VTLSNLSPRTWQNIKDMVIDPHSLLRDVTSEVPEIWNQAASFSCLFTFEMQSRRQLQPFDARFSLAIGGSLSNEAVAHVVHYARTVHTAQCYRVHRATYTTKKSKAKRTKNREVVDWDDGRQQRVRWDFTGAHIDRLVAIGIQTGSTYNDIADLDLAIREQRAHWDPLKTITTPVTTSGGGGRSFLYVKKWDRWIDVSYVGPESSPALATSLS